MKQKRFRRVFLTWNNWKEDFNGNIEVFDYFKKLAHVRAFIIAFEIGKKGTEHLQAVIFFDEQKRFNTLRSYFKNNHIEQVISAKGSIEYVKKTDNFITYGELPINTQGKRTDLEDFKNAIIEGATDLELLENYTSQYMRYEKLIGKIRQLHNQEYYSVNNRDNLKVIYIGGWAGVGKTSLVYELFDIKDVYRVNNYDNPFDMYDSHKVLVLDEYGGTFKDTLDDALMLNVLDRYPLMLPARYYNKWAVYDTVIIISNLPFEKVFDRYEKDREDAFKRRFDLIEFMHGNNREEIKRNIKNLLMEEDLPF